MPLRGDHLQAYGNIERDVRKSIKKISGKFAQTAGHPAVIALWNDDGDLDEVEVRFAVKELQGSADLLGSLEGVLHGYLWIGTKHVHYLPMRSSGGGSLEGWATELEAIRVSRAINTLLGQRPGCAYLNKALESAAPRDTRAPRLSADRWT